MSSCNTATYKRLQRPLFRPCKLYRPRHKTVHKALQALFRLFAMFRRYCMAVHPAIPHHLRRAGAHTRARTHSSAYQIPPPHQTPHRLAQPPIIIRYIRMQRRTPVMDPCQTVQYITDHARPAWSAPAACGSLASAAPGAPAEGSASPPKTGSARRLAIWHRSAVRAHRLALSTRRSSPAAGVRRAARNHWRLPPQLFSGFRPIANRGQQ